MACSSILYSVFAPGIPDFLCKPRAECTLTVVNRGPKGSVCTGTHKGHTGLDSCSKICKFTPTQSSIHSLMQLRSDRIDGLRRSISLHTCWRLLRRRLSRRVLLRVSARVQCSSLARGVVKGGGPAPARRRARQVTPQLPQCERGEPSIPVSAGNGGALAGTGAERAVWAVHAALR
jgi:hypothetical protein